MSDYTIHFDGSCGPTNPGPYGGYGVVIKRDGVMCYSESGPLVAEVLSNNYAEFYALYKGLEWADLVLTQSDKLFVRGDSQLVINVMSRKFRSKESGIYYPAYLKAVHVLTSIRDRDIPVTFNWVPREMNKEADKLSTEYSSTSGERS